MTMKEIAQKLGLSVATVSRAINNKPNVNPETKKIIKEFTEKIMYTPNAAAQKLAKKDNKTIGILVPTLSNPFFSELIDNVCKLLYNNNYQVIIYNSNNDFSIEKASIKEMVAARVNGAIIILAQSNYDENPLMAFEKLNIPSILLDREMYAYEGAGIYLDNEKGAYDITKNLIMKNCKNIGFLTGNLNLKTASDRFAGYKRALLEYNIPLKEENIFYGDFTIKSGLEAYKKLNLHKIDGLFASNNLMLIGFLKGQKNKNKNLQLACFDKISLLEILDYNITFCEFSFDNICNHVLKFLENNEKNQIYITPMVKG